VHELSAQALLEVWELGVDRSPAQRAVDLLTAAGLQDSADDVLALSVGTRDGALLTLREWTFGSALCATASCPQCGAELELDFETADVRVEGPGEPAPVRADGRELTFRLPTGADLMAAEREADADRALRVLLERCVEVRDGDGPPTALTAAAVQALAQAMAAADPQADVIVSAACPDCDAEATLPLDVAAYFWREIETWADRVLREVSALARAHGWTEAEVLALSPRRRRYYLEAAGW
jgi:hypothetical protein